MKMQIIFVVVSEVHPNVTTSASENLRNVKMVLRNYIKKIFMTFYESNKPGSFKKVVSHLQKNSVNFAQKLLIIFIVWYECAGQVLRLSKLLKTHISLMVQ